MDAYFLKLPYIHVYGDSKYVVDGICGRISASINDGSRWLDRISYLHGKFRGFSIQHIYKELNTCADALSKRGLRVPYSSIQISHYRLDSLLDYQEYPIP